MTAPAWPMVRAFPQFRVVAALAALAKAGESARMWQGFRRPTAGRAL